MINDGISNISKMAISYIKEKKNIRVIIEDVVRQSNVGPQENPVSIFMAGSPGAGKTEFSKRFLKELKHPFVRVDPDEVRDYLPGYTGDNSSEFHSAVSIGVEKICDYVIKNRYNLLLDGTLASLDVARKNINRSLRHGRKVAIFYLFQNPQIAWEFTQKREKREGRKITKGIFVSNLIDSHENVNVLKKEFGSAIQILLIEKDYKHSIVQFKVNIDDLDKYLDFSYDKESLRQNLKDVV